MSLLDKHIHTHLSKSKIKLCKYKTVEANVFKCWLLCLSVLNNKYSYLEHSDGFNRL